jgi:hypothetical protein
MPADLDDLFTALGRQADAIPIAPAEQARRRGTHRRNRAAIAGAVAVCLVAGGVVGLLHRSGRQATPTVAPSGALREVGAPITLGGTYATDWTTIAGGRVHILWHQPDGTFRILTADLKTGDPQWTAHRKDAPDTLAGLYTVTQAVALVSERLATVYDPADGHRLWEQPLTETERLVAHNHAAIRASGRTGQLAAYDWRTGKQRWTLAGLGEVQVTTVVVRSAGQMGPDGATDPRLVQVASDGRVRVVDVDTGEVSRAFTIPARAEDSLLIASGQYLITQDKAGTPYRMRATDLGTGESAVVFTGTAGNDRAEFDMLQDRLYVQDESPAGSRVIAIDPRTGRQLWAVRAAAPAAALSGFGTRVLTMGQTTTALYDENGRTVYRAPNSSLHWLTSETLLNVTPNGAVQRIRATDGHAEPLGEIGLQIGPCDQAPDRLACPTIDGLRIWSFGG